MKWVIYILAGYALCKSNNAGLWWSLLAALTAMLVSGVITLTSERLAKEKYAEQAGFPPEMAMQVPLRVSQFGEYRRIAFTALLLNIAFTVATVGLSIALLAVD